jgi:hypothetical protein
MITPEQLLQELESLSHSARIQRMVALGREAATTDPALKNTIAALEQDTSSYYPRYLALYSCFGSRDGTHVLRALTDASRLVRALALSLVGQVCQDSEVVSALEKSDLRQRRALLRHLLKLKRQSPIDTFLEKLAAEAQPRDMLDKLLPFGSEELISRYQAKFLNAAGGVAWAKLARLHPAMALRLLREEADSRQQFDPRLLWLVQNVLPTLAKKLPEETLGLVRSLVRYIPLARLFMQPLALARPVELADLVLTSDSKATFNLAPRADRLGTERFLKLLKHQPEVLGYWQSWFRRLTPAERATLFETLRFGWQNAEGIIPVELVALLPAALRQEEGRRQLGLVALATRPQQRLPYASFLPWEETRSMLDPFIRNPEPELRIAALSALVYGVRYERSRLPELLGLVRARRNEQDPVRGAMLRGLAALPSGMWQAEHLEELGQILREGLDAADLSVTTAAAMGELVVKILPFHPQWAANWLATLVKERGQINFYQLGQRLSESQVRELAPVLLPVLESWETREREYSLIQAAHSFGKRLKVFEGLLDLLERVLKETKNSWVAEGALRLIAEHRHYRLASLIPALLKEDSSWVTRQVVYTYLHRRRQDLLTPYLGQQSYSGRFSTGRTRYVLPLYKGFERWTPAQQTIFARTLERVTRDQERDTPSLGVVIGQLAALPAIQPIRLSELAALDNPKPAVRDSAIRALAGLDSGQGLPLLLEALGDERARIAIYALRKALLTMSSEQALPLLKGVPMEKVTVAKEVVRLMGELATEEAYRELMARARQSELHRDIRIALLRALWSYLDRAETWELMEQAAASPDPAVATATGRIPAERLSEEGQLRLVRLLAKLLAYPDPKVRLDTLARCSQLPVADREKQLLPALLAALSSPLPDECTGATEALFATYTGEGAKVSGEAVGEILSLRRNLQTLVGQLEMRLGQSRSYYLEAGRAALTGLAEDHLTLNLQLRLAVQVLNSEELAEFLSRLVANQQLHAEGLVLAIQLLSQSGKRFELTELEKLESQLAGSQNENLRRLALAVLVAQSQPPNGWDTLRRRRLTVYQSDTSALVASAAQFTFPPLE